MTDIAAIVTGHSETLVAGPTMRSAEASVARAEAEGFIVDRLIGLDNPTMSCRDFFAPFAANGWRIVEVDFRDQGLARNAYAGASSARWIAFLDGDDLWSENWLSEAGRALQAADEMGERVILHPELNWFFDKSASLVVNIDQRSALFEPRHFYFRNFYDALAMAPRDAHLDFPFSARDLVAGYAYEDMQWAIETLAANWSHRVARDTIIFKRRRQNSQTIRASQRGVVIRDIDPMRIDRIRRLGALNPA